MGLSEPRPRPAPLPFPVPLGASQSWEGSSVGQGAILIPEIQPLKSPLATEMNWWRIYNDYDLKGPMFSFEFITSCEFMRETNIEMAGNPCFLENEIHRLSWLSVHDKKLLE